VDVQGLEDVGRIRQSINAQNVSILTDVMEANGVINGDGCSIGVQRRPSKLNREGCQASGETFFRSRPHDICLASKSSTTTKSAPSTNTASGQFGIDLSPKNQQKW
jgi:hypothetical protein